MLNKPLKLLTLLQSKPTKTGSARVSTSAKCLAMLERDEVKKQREVEEKEKEKQKQDREQKEKENEELLKTKEEKSNVLKIRSSKTQNQNV